MILETVNSDLRLVFNEYDMYFTACVQLIPFYPAKRRLVFDIDCFHAES